MALFLDTSVLVKLYIEEEWSEWARALVSQPAVRGRLFISELVLLEVHAVLGRLVRTGKISHSDLLLIVRRLHQDAEDGFNIQLPHPDILPGAIARIDLFPALATGAIDMYHLETVAFLGRRLPQLPTIALAAADRRLLKAAHAYGVEFECPPELLRKVIDS